MSRVLQNNSTFFRLYGDETWLKMFPDSFQEADPVTSFFISDYKHVSRLVVNYWFISSYKGG